MEHIEFDPSKTALVVIDLQKGIVGMDVQPRSAAAVVQNARRLADGLREQGVFIVFVRVSTSADGKDRLHPACDTPLAAGGARPADWAELVPELAVRSGDCVLVKRQWGAFYGTDLDLQLRRRGIRTIVLCGIATCFGVESTARDAYELGYEQIFVEDAMASRSALEHEHTISRILPRIGRLTSTNAVLAGASAQPS
jgi:nicotinamidase-related amidase